MNIRHEPVWLSPEQIVEIAFAQARVVLLNEARNGPRRCIRTRQLGLSILPTAHQMGVRHLAMEALYPEFAEQCNRTRHVPLDGRGYLAQPEMQTLIQAALDSGWTLLAYEADPRKWLAARKLFATQPCTHPTRASRSINWPVLLAKVRVSNRVFPDPRERVMLTLGGSRRK